MTSMVMPAMIVLPAAKDVTRFQVVREVIISMEEVAPTIFQVMPGETIFQVKPVMIRWTVVKAMTISMAEVTMTRSPNRSMPIRR